MPDFFRATRMHCTSGQAAFPRSVDDTYLATKARADSMEPDELFPTKPDAQTRARKGCDV